MIILINLINVIIYFLILLGIYFIFENSIVNCFNKNIRFLYKKRKKSWIFLYLQKLFISIYETDSEKELESKVYTFMFSTIFIFIVVFLVIFKYNFMLKNILASILNSIIPTCIISLIPFFSLRIKLYELQKNSSKEALIITSEIFNQYKIYNNNIIEAIDASIKNLDKSIICRRYLIRLSMKLKDYRTDKELYDCLDEFVFAVNTNWIKMLSDSILFSLLNNLDISLSLGGLIEQIGTINQTQSISNRLNNEGFAMGKYLAPVLYISLLVISVKMMGFNIQDILYCQFTGQGLKFFIIILILFIGCYIAEYLYKSRKFDF
ncbi:hypothetical protein JYG23_09460 [Sedimentibacter sp. zth1]|uniref:hypothetical protein n=1 Tax=Sedimentibacter sp. zth1 TaxID=2816908 RepID=UPI001A90F1AE|nr:hypothetical protein [Sedimentibacter sp. zth1]QSX04918.1 hypothetical protein JYG23_09460 [Sedimentibacter sp. zth1]